MCPCCYVDSPSEQHVFVVDIIFTGLLTGNHLLRPELIHSTMLYTDDGQQQQRGHYVPVTQSDADGRLHQLHNDSLSLDDATAADAGYYLCHASNGVGADLSKVIRLVVHSQ